MPMLLFWRLNIYKLTLVDLSSNLATLEIQTASQHLRPWLLPPIWTWDGFSGYIEMLMPKFAYWRDIQTIMDIERKLSLFFLEELESLVSFKCTFLSVV